MVSSSSSSSPSPPLSPSPSPSPPLSPPPSPSLSTIPIKKKGQVRKQQIFSSQLYQALARVNLPSARRQGQATVHEAADRILARMANRTTRWSRAILTRHCLKRRLLQPKPLRHKPLRISIRAPPITRSRSPIVYRLKGKKAARVQRKMKFLGRLIPGCGKQKEPIILKEAADYIPALQMQVQAMNDLLNFLSHSSSTPPLMPASPSSSVASNSTSPASTITSSSSSSTDASTSAPPS